MLRSNRDKQRKYELVSIEDLVHTDHMLRKIDKNIDFSFINGKVRHLYCQGNGHPAIDQLVLFKMIFQRLLRSESQLEREGQTNITDRCFLLSRTYRPSSRSQQLAGIAGPDSKILLFLQIFLMKSCFKRFLIEWLADVCSSLTRPM